MKEGIFIGSQIKQLFKDQEFSTKLNSTELKAWQAHENVSGNFLDNGKVEKYSKNVQELISSHSAMGCNMSWKTSCAAFRLDFFS